MEENIIKLLGRKDYVPANVPELLALLDQPANQQQKLQESLRELEQIGQIARIKGNRYILPKEADLISGRIQITRHGRGFLLPDEAGVAEISIPANNTSTALHDDHVLVRRDVRPRGRRPSPDTKDSGTVVRIIERRRTRIVGTLRRGRELLYVIPDDPRMPHDIYVPPAKDVGRPARTGDKVVVELRQWESRHTNPEGEIIEVLGPPTAEGVDMLSVLRGYDLPLHFPKEVLQEVSKYKGEVTSADRSDRTDCRQHDVITIDPADAKDFDDAFCLQPTEGNRWKLWVHIADVSHYVKPGSALDDEARRRGNSTYLVDRVIPMLPEALSNELCSLKPHVDRLTKCVEFVIGDGGEIISSKFYPALIHSKRRYSYEEAMEVLAGKANDDTERMLQSAGRLAARIRKRRFQSGSLELDFPESKIRLDDNGRVAKIEEVVYDESHQLIEEFMLLANEAVAGKLMKLRTPTVYRVHENPDPKRLAEYREEVLSQNIICGNLEKPEEVQKLMRRLNGLAIGPALKIGFLKSLMRARYATEPLGHYGLAKAKYTHFTSPIRRYADLVVHRSLFEKTRDTHLSLKKVADHISATERNSADAERDSKNVKLYAYLNSQLNAEKPQKYSALVTDIRNFGFFVDVSDLGMRGLVPLSKIENDFYEFDESRGEIKGRRTRRVVRLGDVVEVEVANVDSFKKQVDFTLLPLPGESGEGRGRTSSKKSGSRGKPNRRRGPNQEKGSEQRRRSPSSKKRRSGGGRNPNQNQNQNNDQGQGQSPKSSQASSKKSGSNPRPSRKRSSNRNRRPPNRKQNTE